MIPTTDLSTSVVIGPVGVQALSYAAPATGAPSPAYGGIIPQLTPYVAGATFAPPPSPATVPAAIPEAASPALVVNYDPVIPVAPLVGADGAPSPPAGMMTVEPLQTPAPAIGGLPGADAQNGAAGSPAQRPQAPAAPVLAAGASITTKRGTTSTPPSPVQRVAALAGAGAMAYLAPMLLHFL